jgi:hypothetical protein
MLHKCYLISGLGSSQGSGVPIATDQVRARIHFSLNIGSEVLRLQDFAQIILKFSWGGKSPTPFHIGPHSGPIYLGPVIFFFLSRPL